MKPKKTRLTLAQQRFLREVAADPGMTCWDEYPPMLKLVELRFLSFERGTFNAKVAVTDAGRAWLAARDLELDADG